MKKYLPLFLSLWLLGSPSDAGTWVGGGGGSSARIDGRSSDLLIDFLSDRAHVPDRVGQISVFSAEENVLSILREWDEHLTGGLGVAPDLIETLFSGVWQRVLWRVLPGDVRQDKALLEAFQSSHHGLLQVHAVAWYEELPRPNSRHKSTVFISGPAWQRLDDISRVGLIMHEALRYHKTANSKRFNDDSLRLLTRILTLCRPSQANYELALRVVDGATLSERFEVGRHCNSRY